MVLITLGVLDLSRGYRMQIRLDSAAREGAVLAQIYPSDVDCPTRNDIKDRVRAEDPSLLSLKDFRIEVFTENASGDVVVPVTGCGTGTAQSGDRVRVEVVATFDVITPVVERIVGSTIELTGSSEIEVQ